MPLPGNLLDPIPGASPCGENLYYSPVYDKIREARREEEEIPQGDWRYEVKKADYAQVLKLASDSRRVYSLQQRNQEVYQCSH